MFFRHRSASVFTRRFASPMVTAILSCLLAAPAFADEAADVLNLLKSSRHAEALAKADAAISAKPRDPQLRFLKGVILSEMNRPAEAITIFNRLTEDQPQLPEPWNNLAVLYAAQGQYDKARAALEKAIRTNPSYATAYENLGDIHAKLAGMAYDRALQVDSGNANARSKLTLVRNLAPVNSAPPKSVDTTPVPRPQSLPQPLPPSLPQIAQAPQAPTPRSAAPQAAAPQAAPQPVAPQPAPPQAAAPQTAAPQPQKAAPAPAPVASAPAKPEAEHKSRAAAKAADAERDAVIATVHAWARDWSERDVKGYLSHYANDFETPGKQSRKAWADERQSRITGKGRIQVKVEAPQVSVDNGRATVKFRQQYSSDRLTASSRKTLTLVRQKGRWLIQKEVTGS